METTCTYLPYAQTNYFSRIAIDYITGEKQLQPFYEHPVSVPGIIGAINERQKFPQQRQKLVDALLEQYKDVPQLPLVEKNIRLLAEDTTFTITTAHQPNIFTGPLYFAFKILHVIKIAAELNRQLPEYRFVPVYFMGSEDADLEELGNVTIDGVRHTWRTRQTGAVGRMKVDKELLGLIGDIERQLMPYPYGQQLVELFKKAYTPGKTIQQATLELVNALFGAHGLVVLIPDNRGLKELFSPVIEKELREQFSSKAVSDTLAALEKNYKSQAAGRELNLFYLLDDKRERIEIERKEDKRTFRVHHLNREFSEEGILAELKEYPERFSPNVILRGVFQEYILPNIVFVGGGGELAYWLELKNVFHEAAVPYPVLILRNSFLIIEKKYRALMASVGIQVTDLFRPDNDLIKKLVVERSGDKTGLNGHLEKVESLYDQIMSMASGIDVTLKDHVAALKTRAVYRLQELEKKMFRAERRKYEDELRQLKKIKSALFPGGNLQERTENLSYYYAAYGNNLLDVLLTYSLTLEQQFGVVEVC